MLNYRWEIIQTESDEIDQNTIEYRLSVNEFMLRKIIVFKDGYLNKSNHN